MLAPNHPTHDQVVAGSKLQPDGGRLIAVVDRGVLLFETFHRSRHSGALHRVGYARQDQRHPEDGAVGIFAADVREREDGQVWR